MKPPRVSLATIMVVVFAIAADCFAFRSLHSRPLAESGVLEVMLLGTLPMAKILAVGLSRLTLRPLRRGTRQAFWVGFVACGILAVLVTALGLERALLRLETALASTASGAWLDATPIAASAVAYGLLPGCILLLQLLAAMVGGFVLQRLSGELEAVEAVAPSRRRELIGRFALLVLLAVPAFIVEGTLHFQVDPLTVRQSAGTRAIVDVNVMSGWRVSFRDGSTQLLPNGSEVRIDDDSQPSTFVGIKTSRGEQFGDHRSVIVTLLDGERNGQPASVPRQFLRPIR